MLLDGLYHPPSIAVGEEQGRSNGSLYLVHRFEGKPLVKEFIANTMLGIEYLWGGTVQLETNEIVSVNPPLEEGQPRQVEWARVLYTMDNRKLSRRHL